MATYGSCSNGTAAVHSLIPVAVYTTHPNGHRSDTPAPPILLSHRTPPPRPQASITREEFEALAADFFSRAAAPLRRVLERNGVKVEELDAVELLGGGSRVPRLQAALSEVLGGRGLDRWGQLRGGGGYCGAREAAAGGLAGGCSWGSSCGCAAVGLGGGGLASCA